MSPTCRPWAQRPARCQHTEAAQGAAGWAASWGRGGCGQSDGVSCQLKALSKEIFLDSLRLVSMNARQLSGQDLQPMKVWGG